MADKFFEEEKEEKQPEPEKIKVGETDFTKEELEGLVGKAKKIDEFEKKQGQSWEEVATSWGKRGERLGAWKKATGAKDPSEFEKLRESEKEKPKEQVDEEKLRQEIRAQAQKFGLLTREEAAEMFEKYYTQQRGGERIYSKVSSVLLRAKRDGNPVTTPDKLLEFMADPNNPKDPTKAYKLMFEKELDEIKLKKLESIKKPGMFTETKSTAGGKEFTPPKVTKENLKSVLKQHFQGGGEG